MSAYNNPKRTNNNKIVFINQWASHLTKDIMNAATVKFDKVAFIGGQISASGRPLKKEIRISRIVRYRKNTTLSRIVTWLLATIQVIILINVRFRNYHLFLTSNPPTLAFVPSFCRNTYSIQILDVYPDALVAGKLISQQSWLNKLWTNRNKKYFSRADHVFTITDGMARTISQYCDPQKISTVVQWPSSDEYDFIDRQKNKFIQKHELEDYFIVMYSGNMGLGHHVDALVEVARELRNNDEIMFVIIGEGWNKPIIEKKISEYGLKNCLLLPFQSTEMFKHSSQAADIGVVSVSRDLAMLSVPIKTYNLIRNNIPLLCITEGESELNALVTKYEIGKAFGPNQVKGMSDFIITLKKESGRIAKYKKNLKRCAVNFTSQNARKYFSDFEI